MVARSSSLIYIRKNQSIKKSKIDPETEKDCLELDCPLKMKSSMCYCHMRFFKVRPYTFQFLNGIFPFYEFIGVADLPFKELDQVMA